MLSAFHAAVPSHPIRAVDVEDPARCGVVRCGVDITNDGEGAVEVSVVEHVNLKVRGGEDSRIHSERKGYSRSQAQKAAIACSKSIQPRDGSPRNHLSIDMYKVEHS